MPVDSQHPDHARALSWWTRCRDVHAGQDAIRGKATTYLPLLEAHTGTEDKEYRAYLLRAYFYNGTARTIEAHSGYVFRKPAEVTVPERIGPHLVDATLNAESFDAFAARVFDEVVNPGRAAILVDWSDTDQRPYCAMYRAEEVINWQTAIVAGKRILTMVVLREETTQPGPDEFTPETVTQYRHLYLDETGVCRVGVWRPQGDQNKKTLVRVEERTPLRRGAPLPFIPVQIFNAVSLDFDVDKPPLLDMVDANLAIYTLMADWRHLAHFAAMPTAYVVGVPQTVKNLPMGSSIAWILNDSPNSKAGMLEVSGAGSAVLEKQIEQRKQEMAVLGSRLLEQQPLTQETATAVEMRQSGQTASLRRMALTASSGFTRVLQWFVWWDGASDEILDPEVMVRLNTDFVSQHIAPGLLSEMTKALQEGAISKETYYHTLEQGELTIPGRTFEEEQQAILAEMGEREAAMAEDEPEPDEDEDKDEDDDEGEAAEEDDSDEDAA